MVPRNGAINNINANNRIGIASKLRITQIICHGYNMIDSIKFNQQDIISAWNKTREACKK